MGFKKFTADYIFNGKDLLTNAILVVNEAGTVEDIVDETADSSDVQRFEGVLMPGMINAHCHLELSHMKGAIPPKTGLINFLISVVTNRSSVAEEVILKHIEAAEAEMYANGISGVADICNTGFAVQTKAQSKLAWYNLIEVINLFDAGLPAKLEANNKILQMHTHLPGDSVLTPHAPYTVSSATFKAINSASAGKLISIHNQESKAENELFEKGSGEFLNLYAALGIKEVPIPVSQKTSLQTYLPFFAHGQTLLLVHNTFTTEADVLFAKAYAEANFLKIVYCLCPNANLYIEDAWPPVDLLLKHDCKIVLGTDSYSSNWSLSIAAEIQTLLKKFPHLPLATVLQWATANGADTFGWQHLGSFDKGKTPGVVLLGLNKENKIPTGEVRRIL